MFFIDEHTYVAIGCAVAGCLIRYLHIHKHKGSIKISYLIGDVLTAAFLGYLFYWILAEHNLVKSSYASLITCFIGNLGSRVFDIISWYMHTRYGLPNFKYEKSEGQDASTWNKK